MGFMDERTNAYPAIKFETKGEAKTGVLLEEPYERMMKSKFHPDLVRTWLFNLDVAGEKQTLFVPHVGFLAGAIEDACKAASVDNPKIGDTIKVAWINEQDTGKGNPAKVYKAVIEPGTPAAAAADDPFGEEPF